MAGRNGIAMLPGARRTIVLRSETISYDLVLDGEPILLEVYCKGPGVPLPVLIDMDDALATLDENEPTEDERPTFAAGAPPVPGIISIRRYLAKAQYAERTLRREMLQAVSKTPLSVDHANVLASDDGPWKDILIETGWRTPDADTEATDEDDAEGEAVAQSSGPTGDSDSPASAPASPAETR